MDNVNVADSKATGLVEFFLSALIDGITEMMKILLFILMFRLDAASPVDKSVHYAKQCLLKVKIFFHLYCANQKKCKTFLT